MQNGVASDALKQTVRQRRRRENAVANGKEVFARTFAHVTLFVEHNSLGIAVVLCLELCQDGVHVGSGRLNGRRNCVEGTLTPRRNAHLDAVLKGVFAHVSTPRPYRDDNVHGSTRRVYAHLAIAIVCKRTNVARLQFVLLDKLNGCFAQLVYAVGKVHHGNLGAALQTLHVVAKAEDDCFIRFFVVVATDTFEHARTVMKGMGQNVRRCLLPRHHFAVLPDVLNRLHVSHLFFLSRFFFPQSPGRVSTPRWELFRFSILLQLSRVM